MTILNYDYSEEHQDQVNNEADNEAEHQQLKKRRTHRKKNNKPNNQDEKGNVRVLEHFFYNQNYNLEFSEDTMREVQRLMEIVKNHPITINGEFPVNFHTRLYSQEIIQISNIFGKRYHEKNKQDYDELIRFLNDEKAIITLMR